MDWNVKAHCWSVAVTNPYYTYYSIPPVATEGNWHASRQEPSPESRLRVRQKGKIQDSRFIGGKWWESLWPLLVQILGSDHIEAQYKPATDREGPPKTNQILSPLLGGGERTSTVGMVRAGGFCRIDFRWIDNNGDLEILYFTSGQDSAVHNKAKLDIW